MIIGTIKKPPFRMEATFDTDANQRMHAILSAERPSLHNRRSQHLSQKDRITTDMTVEKYRTMNQKSGHCCSYYLNENTLQGSKVITNTLGSRSNNAITLCVSRSAVLLVETHHSASA